MLWLAILAVPPPPATLPAVRGGDEPSPLFEEVGATVLAGVTTTCGSTGKDYIVEVNGGGLALGDFDADGDPDLVVVDGSTLERVRAGEPGFPPRLFLNDGGGSFEPAGDAWAMQGGRWGMGAAAGDVDGDGFLDLFVSQWGPDRLFLNQDGEGFREATEGSGLSTAGTWGTSGAFLDYDRDGKLDLAVVNYLAFREDEIASRAEGACRWKGHAVMCGPEGLIPVHDKLYRGRGDGTFRDATVAAGFRPERAAFGLGVTTLDYDVDGDTDVYVTNDSTPNFLWENQGDGTFREVGFFRDVSHDASGKEQAGMGIACGDLNADGAPDLLVTNFSAENNALYLSSVTPRGVRYRERSSPARIGGPSRVFLGWGTSMDDFDNDGDLDCAVFNGHVYPQADRPGTDTSYAQPDHLYRNDGSGRFAVEPLSDAGAGVSRACTRADLDGDGDLDLVALEMNGAVRVLRNAGARGNGLVVRLRASGEGSQAGNTQALGARVSASFRPDAESALVQHVREVRTSGGFQSAVPADVHFGLGAAERVAELRVRWPSGAVQVLADVPAGQVLELTEPAPEGGE